MKLLLLTAAGVIGVAGVGSAVAAPGSVATKAGGDTAVVGPALGAASSAVGLGSGTGPALVTGAVGTALAPVSQQQPEVGAAVASATAQTTASLSQGGAQAAQALQTAHDQASALAPVVNPVVHPVLDAVAAQLAPYQDLPDNAAISGQATYLVNLMQTLKGSSG
jgi:hypothetical protein